MSDAEVVKPDLRRAYLILFAVGLGSFLTAMSLSIVFVVYPDLVEEFPNSSNSTLSWVLNVFTIVGTPLFILGAVAGERYGRKRTMVLGLVGFTAASVLAALAPNPGWLIAARAIQAVFTALHLADDRHAHPQHVPRVAPRHRRAAWSAIGGVAAALGPSLGGWLVDTWSWRAAFWINVPIGTIATFAAVTVLDESKNETPPAYPMWSACSASWVAWASWFSVSCRAAGGVGAAGRWSPRSWLARCSSRSSCTGALTIRCHSSTSASSAVATTPSATSRC